MIPFDECAEVRLLRAEVERLRGMMTIPITRRRIGSLYARVAEVEAERDEAIAELGEARAEVDRLRETGEERGLR